MICCSDRRHKGGLYWDRRAQRDGRGQREDPLRDVRDNPPRGREPPKVRRDQYSNSDEDSSVGSGSGGSGSGASGGRKTKPQSRAIRKKSQKAREQRALKDWNEEKASVDSPKRKKKRKRPNAAKSKSKAEAKAKVAAGKTKSKIPKTKKIKKKPLSPKKYVLF
jgi:hypothetical protein